MREQNRTYAHHSRYTTQEANMNLYDERALVEEVIYLHSLWHQGPNPTPSPNPLSIPIGTPSYPYNHNSNNASLAEPYAGPHFHGHLRRPHQQRTINPIPTHQFAPAHTRSLPPTTSSPFSKKKNKKDKRRDPAANNVGQPDPPSSSGPEWPCPVRPDPPAAGWPAPKKPRLAAPAVSPQEKERLAVLQSQNKACRAFREFLLGDDDDDEEEEEEDDDDVDDDEWEECEGFFVRIFMEDEGLRSYYQRFFEGGEFCCLVCGAVGKKSSGKKFKDCAGLVQHSMSILRTVKKRAHRAFGHAVCKVLGWDIDRLPIIVMKGEPLGGSVKIKPSEEECSTKEGDLHNKAENVDEKMLDIGVENGEVEAQDEVSLESLVSGAEWVCKNPNFDSSSTASVWPTFHTKSSSHASSLSAEEQANVAVLQMQHKALKACQEYLAGNADSYGDDDNDSEDEDDLTDDSDPEEREEFKFFLKLFIEDSDLRRYYENNCRKGDFYCLVCGGVGKKMWKRFKDCVALLQHSTAIKRTKRKLTHRAYSQVICKVLGWDIDRLPAIVLKGESLGSCP